MRLSRRSVLAGIAVASCLPAYAREAFGEGRAGKLDEAAYLPRAGSGDGMRDAKIEERFHALVPRDACLRRVADGFEWCEGPVWAPAFGGLVFSDVRANQEYVFTPETGSLRTLREPSRFANGHAVDRYGDLVACEHQGRCISLTGPTGGSRVLADSWRGMRFNSPNDVVVKSDGSIWFTDPQFGLRNPQEGGQGQAEMPRSYVFRFDPIQNRVDAVTDAIDQPNGIAFSPDEAVLYVSDTSRSLTVPGESEHSIFAFRVSPNGTLSNRQLFATVSPGVPDGFAVDTRGNLFSSAGDGVHVFSPRGAMLGLIPTPKTAANLAFGGRDGRTLYICASDALYAIDLATRGMVHG
jgi:gluconolactonase